MSVLSMLAFRMATQEGLHKCLRIYEELRKSGEHADEKAATPTATTSDMHDAKSSSKSARRRIRRRRLRESRRGEDTTTTTTKPEEMVKEEEQVEGGKEAKDDEKMGVGTMKSRENESDDERSVDVGPYNLVTHHDRRTGKDFLERSLMAAFLLKCLQRVGFFVQPTPDDGTYRIGPLLTFQLAGRI